MEVNFYSYFSVNVVTFNLCKSGRCEGSNCVEGGFLDEL